MSMSSRISGQAELLPDLWGKANQHLRNEGVEWSFSRISAFNPGSLHAHSKLGIRILFSASPPVPI